MLLNKQLLPTNEYPISLKLMFPAFLQEQTNVKTRLAYI